MSSLAGLSPSPQTAAAALYDLRQITHFDNFDLGISMS